MKKRFPREERNYKTGNSHFWSRSFLMPEIIRKTLLTRTGLMNCHKPFGPPPPLITGGSPPLKSLNSKPHHTSENESEERSSSVTCGPDLTVRLDRTWNLLNQCSTWTRLIGCKVGLNTAAHNSIGSVSSCSHVRPHDCRRDKMPGIIPSHRSFNQSDQRTAVEVRRRVETCFQKAFSVQTA